jgi:hypothetical protein
MAFTVILTPATSSIRKGHTALLEATIDGSPVGDVTYVWYVDDELQEGEESATFEYISTEVGEFTIKVEATDEDDPPVTEDDTAVVTVTFPFGRKGRLYGR